MIYFKSPSEWGHVIHSFYKDLGQLGTVLTFFEIINTEDQEFSGIDEDLLKKSIETLVKGGRAVIFSASQDSLGVKFF